VHIFSPLSGLRELQMRDLERGWSGAILIFEDVRPFVNALARPADVATDRQPVGRTSPRTAARKARAVSATVRDMRNAIFAAITAAVAVLALSVVGPA